MLCISYTSLFCYIYIYIGIFVVTFLPVLARSSRLKLTGLFAFISYTVEAKVSTCTIVDLTRPAMLSLSFFFASFLVNRASCLRTPHRTASGFLHSPRSVVPIGQA